MDVANRESVRPTPLTRFLSVISRPSTALDKYSTFDQIDHELELRAESPPSPRKCPAILL